MNKCRLIKYASEDKVILGKRAFLVLFDTSEKFRIPATGISFNEALLTRTRRLTCLFIFLFKR